MLSVLREHEKPWLKSHAHGVPRACHPGSDSRPVPQPMGLPSLCRRLRPVPRSLMNWFLKSVDVLTHCFSSQDPTPCRPTSRQASPIPPPRSLWVATPTVPSSPRLLPARPAWPSGRRLAIRRPDRDWREQHHFVNISHRNDHADFGGFRRIRGLFGHIGQLRRHASVRGGKRRANHRVSDVDRSHETGHLRRGFGAND